MPALSSWEQGFRFLSACCYAGLLYKLLRTRLYRTYAIFTAFVAVELSQELALLPIPLDTNLYALIFFCSEPVIWIFYFLIVIELYGLVLHDYPAIAYLGRWAVWIVLPLSLAISFLIAAPEFRAARTRIYPILHTFQIFHNAVVFGVLSFLASIFFLILRYPVRLTRNVVLYCCGYAVLFGTKTALLFLLEKFGFKQVPILNVIMMSASCACLVLWILALNRRGEAREVVLAPPWEAGEKDRLRRQLQSVNSLAVRLVRNR